jgi:hypothetical protein
MTKPKTWADVERSPDVDWPPREADHRYGPNRRSPCRRFTYWCYASGHDAGDPDARRMFECLLAYARLDEGRAGLN